MKKLNNQKMALIAPFTGSGFEATVFILTGACIITIVI